jgi:hypothetical protein
MKTFGLTQHIQLWSRKAECFTSMLVSDRLGLAGIAYNSPKAIPARPPGSP